MSEFKKGDYIVLTKGAESKSIFLDTCYKQRITSIYIKLELDNEGECLNGWNQHPFNKSNNNDWRYATKQEIEEYDRLGKPYDVTILEKEFILPKQWYIKVTPENAEILNEWKQKVNPDSYNAKECKYVNRAGEGERGSGWAFWGGVLITFEQFKKYVLKESNEWWKTLKKGDIIRCIANKDCYLSKNIGEEYEVCCDFGTGKFPHCIYYKENYSSDKYHEFELVRRANQSVDKPKELTIDNLVEEEIYRFKWVDSVEYIWKFNSREAINITRNAFNNRFLTPGKSSFSNGKLATLEEKKWLNTCIKQDKFIPKEDLDQYDNEGELIDIYKNNPPDYQNILDIEVGDTVKCVSEEDISKFNINNGVGWKANLEFVVKSINNYSKHKVYFGGDQGHGVYSDAIRLVKRKESNHKFEVGKWYKYVFRDHRVFYINPNKNYNLFPSKLEGSVIRDNKFTAIDSWSNPVFIENAELLKDLSEIQQYLPDGHPDKTTQEDSTPVYEPCEYCNGEGTTIEAKLYPGGHTEVTIDCPECEGLGEIEIIEDKPFEFNRWYKTDSHLYFIKSNTEFYGFYGNNWVNELNTKLCLNDFISVSDEEVKEKLLEYAKRKYPKGTKIKSAYNNHNYLDTRIVNDTLQFYYNTMDDIVCNNIGPSVYYKGIWAEIVESPKESIPKYSKGTWLVRKSKNSIDSFIDIKIGDIVEIENYYESLITIYEKYCPNEYANTFQCETPCSDDFEWFATHEKAVEYSKSLKLVDKLLIYGNAGEHCTSQNLIKLKTFNVPKI